MEDREGWEKVAEILAKKGGLNIAEGYTRKFNSHHHCYLSKRFDRLAGNGRIHFASAMTLLGHSDGEEGVSYIELADFIIQYGANTGKNLEELWRRIVFNIAVKKQTIIYVITASCLLKVAGILSPAYDINPVTQGTGLTLNISETDNSLDLGLALSVAKYFRVAEAKAHLIIDEVKKSFTGWQKFADKLSISRSEQSVMANAFEKAFE